MTENNPLEERKRILRSRAERLASVTELLPITEKPGETFPGRLEIVEFLLSDERYGIEIAFVQEVIPLKEFTDLPCTPSYILGIANVRGQMVSIVNIKKFFELSEKGLTNLNRLIVLEEGLMRFGILADRVLGVRSVPISEIQPTVPTLTGVREAYLKGIVPKDWVAILDGKKLLGDKKIIVREEVKT